MTGPLRVPDGTVDAPTLAFASDPSAGFYLSGGKIIPTKPLGGVFPIGFGPVPWSRLTAPTGWVLCYGQTLNRVTYAELWAVAQAEIAASNTLYNNGDGSTTFGICDMRGCVWAAQDALGGAGAGRLSGAFGAFTGAQTHQLSQAELPSTNLTFSGNQISNLKGSLNFQPLSQSGIQINGGALITQGGNPAAPNNSVDIQPFTPSGSISGFGSNGFHNNVQPTRIGGAILYAGA